MLLFVTILAFVGIQGAYSVNLDLAPYNTSAVIGGNATLACLVSDKASTSVRWTQTDSNTLLAVDSTVVASSGSHYELSGEFNLTVLGVTLSDEAQYSCEVGGTPYYGSLTVVDLPSNVSVYWAIRPTTSSTTNLTCHATRGHPPPSLAWYKNDQPYQTADAVYTADEDGSGYGEATSVLPVRLSSSDEGAEFRCVANYPDFNNAMNASIITSFSGYSGSGGSKSVIGCDNLCARSDNMAQTWKEKLTPAFAFWFYSNCGVQSCPDFDSIAASIADLVKAQLC